MHLKLVQALYEESRKHPQTKSPFTQEQVEFLCEDFFALQARLDAMTLVADDHALARLRYADKLKRAEEIARTHGVTWGENRDTENPSTVPQEEIANAIAALARA